tara:strand:- start:51173 stop:51406 length:234 start_codon:yes stop_codon:yes gene_type:complete
MKKIEVFGTGCKKCITIEDMIKSTAKDLGIEIDIHHINDPVEIAMRGIISTPTVVVDGKIVHKGALPSNKEIEEWIK